MTLVVSAAGGAAPERLEPASRSLPVAQSVYLLLSKVGFFHPRIAELRQQISTARDQEEQKQKALETYLLSLDIE